MGRPVAVVKVPLALGRGILAVTETAARLARPGDDPHHRQGERVLSARLDRRSRAAHPRHRMERASATSTTGLADTWHWYRSAGWV